MDLFTIDTAGEKNLLEKDGYEAEEVQYSTKNEEAVNHSENEHSESEEEEDDDENEESENDETEYDYGGNLFLDTNSFIQLISFSFQVFHRLV